MKKIPITVLTGFLGAGKSTILNNILEQRNDNKLAVIVNEFGDVGIDHQLLVPIDEAIYEINEGCICCTVREDLVTVFYNMVQALQEEKIDINHVVIETTGIADVAPILQTLRQVPMIENYYEVDAVITLVDGVNAAYQIENYEEARNQIIYADKIFITKTDLISDTALAEVVSLIRSMQQFIPIENIANGEIAYEKIIGTKLYNSADIDCSEDAPVVCDCGDEHCHHDHEHHHHHEHDVQSIALQTNKRMNIERFDYWLNWLLDLYNFDLLRYKGILCFADTDEEMVMQGVLTNATIDTNYKKIPSEPQSTIVLIGKHLDEEKIREAFETMVLMDVETE